DTSAKVETFTADNLAISVLGQSLTGTFAFTKLTDGQGQFQALQVTATKVSLTLGDGTNALVQVTNGSGALQITPAGLAGDFSGTCDLAVNTTSAAVNETFTVAGVPVKLMLPAGPYLRVAGTGIQLSVSGQTLSGDFAFERLVDGNGAPVVRVAAANVNFALG